jgi:hypothetical protein
MGKKPLFLISTEGMTLEEAQSALRAALRSLLPQEPAEGSSLEESPAEEPDEGEG